MLRRDFLKGSVVTAVAVASPFAARGAATAVKTGDQAQFEIHQLTEYDTFSEGAHPGHDFASWPAEFRESFLAAKARLLKEHSGKQIVKEFSRVDLRVDLSGTPWQFWNWIVLG
jgi:hypothetical protein